LPADPDSTPTDELIGGRDLLIVLDNGKHVLDGLLRERRPLRLATRAPRTHSLTVPERAPPNNALGAPHNAGSGVSVHHLSPA
jgi:hypothetical protein